MSAVWITSPDSHGTPKIGIAFFVLQVKLKGLWNLPGVTKQILKGLELQSRSDPKP